MAGGDGAAAVAGFLGALCGWVRCRGGGDSRVAAGVYAGVFCLSVFERRGRMYR